MTLDDLTVGIRHLDRELLLADWRWLVAPQKHAVLVTLAGNLFVQDEFSGVVDFLDVGSPELFRVADSPKEFRAQLTEREFVYRMFDVPVLAELLKGGAPQAGKLFGFKVLPKLGGKYEPENYEQTDIEVHFSLCGQLQQKLASVPPGTSIGKVTVGEG